MAAHKPITPGTRFHRLTVIGIDPGKRFRPAYLCRCDCGREKVIAAKRLTGGYVKSCGCMARDPVVHKRVTHGLSKTPEYVVYCAMKDRCLNPSNESFHYYGGRGITICGRWLESFDHFIADMGRRPPGGSIDRIDNNGPYSPENCRWASRKTQARNYRRNRIVVFRGERMTLVDAAELAGLNYKTAYHRWRRGIPLDSPMQVASVATCLLCGEPSHCRRLCRTHYNHMHHAGRLAEFPIRR